MPKYISKYVPCELAVTRIAKHFHQGDELAARWEDLAPAISEGSITERPLEDPRTKRRTSGSRVNMDDMLSNIVGGSVLAKGNPPVGEDNQELKNWPEGTWRRQELEEIYGQIFGEDGVAADHQPDGEQDQPSRREQLKADTAARYERWYQWSQEIKSERKRKGDEPLKPIGIAKLVADRERKAGHTEANAETIKRRLNEHYPGWAG